MLPGANSGFPEYLRYLENCLVTSWMKCYQFKTSTFLAINLFPYLKINALNIQHNIECGHDLLLICRWIWPSPC